MANDVFIKMHGIVKLKTLFTDKQTVKIFCFL